jgi:hypothetical protein
MGKHDKFRAYWESIGKPSIDIKYPELSGEWQLFKSQRPNFDDDADYRINDDPHWELHRKWIDSDFTLPIEAKTSGQWHLLTSNIHWHNDWEYREAKQVSETIGDAEIDKTLAERGKRYGYFCNHAKISQSLKNAMHGDPGWCELDASQKEALEMIQHKIARILSGDPNYADNWHDIQGYAKLVEDQING